MMRLTFASNSTVHINLSFKPKFALTSLAVVSLNSNVTVFHNIII